MRVAVFPALPNPFTSLSWNSVWASYVSRGAELFDGVYDVTQCWPGPELFQQYEFVGKPYVLEGQFLITRSMASGCVGYKIYISKEAGDAYNSDSAVGKSHQEVNFGTVYTISGWEWYEITPPTQSAGACEQFFSPPPAPPPPPPNPPAGDRDQPAQKGGRGSKRQLNEITDMETWKTMNGQNSIFVVKEEVAMYCGANDPLDSSASARCRSPHADGVWSGETCATMLLGTADQPRGKICGTGINAEFDFNGHTGATVTCDETEAEFVGVMHGNAEAGGGLGLCEVAVYGLDNDKVLLLGHSTITEKYAPKGFQGFLHFLYDCVLRVWTKMKGRFGNDWMPSLPGETPGKKDGIGR